MRKRVMGTPDRPRLSVFKSLKHTYAQIIDDVSGRTLIYVSTLSPELRKLKKKPVELAYEVGKLIGIKAKEKNISKVVFDRGGHMYHGRVKAVADGAREAGLEF